MANKLAIDWDENELRMVAAQGSGRNAKVTDAAVIPIENGDIDETLKRAIGQRGLENTATLVAIGRGKAELRELQLPPVPDDELPDMVRFQAIRSFATAGDNATVDFLVTNRTETGVEMIAAAVGPSNLASIGETCEGAGLSVERIALRPLAAAALYLVRRSSEISGDTVLIDLLADDAEIVVARDGDVVFVRTVRMPSGEATRARALAGELRRSLVACGSSGIVQRVILWGRESVHSDEKEVLADASGSQVEVVDPFSLVDVDSKASLPEHVGRLAPLVGLLVASDTEADRLIDFLNPRERYVETPSPYRRALLIGVPVAAALLLAFGVYRKLKGLDRQIAELKSANAAMQPDVDRAEESIARTEVIDQFLDGDVNWLSEIRRMAIEMPPSDEMIVRSVSASSNPRTGGGTLKVEGGVVNPSVIDVFEQALRDDAHQVKGDGASEQKTEDAYRWGFTESITIAPEAVRNERYEALTAASTNDAESTSPQEPPSPEEPPPDGESTPEEAASEPPTDQEVITVPGETSDDTSDDTSSDKSLEASEARVEPLDAESDEIAESSAEVL